MAGHRDIANAEDAAKLFPTPWKVHIEGDDCWGILDANGRAVVMTDGGHYPPDRFTAQMICDRVNAPDSPPA